MLLALTPELFRLILDYSVDDVWNQPGNIERALALRLVCSTRAMASAKGIVLKLLRKLRRRYP